MLKGLSLNNLEMKRKKILYLVRAEADLERVISLAIPGQNYCNQEIIYYGDIDLYFERGIRNKFQKYLLSENNLNVLNATSFFFIGKIYEFIEKHLKGNNNKYIKRVLRGLKYIIKVLIENNKDRLAKTILRKITPQILITDYSSTDDKYFPEILRRNAKERGVDLYILPHGPAGALHGGFSTYKKRERKKLNSATLCICSEHDFTNPVGRTIITGDPADAQPFLNYKHSLGEGDIVFNNKSEYRIGFFVALAKETTLSGWSVMEEIILDYAFDSNVSMVVKIHPRMYGGMDIRTIQSIPNVKVYGSELDRSKLVKWANIVVCADHCSTIFEPMILGKKTVAIMAKKAKPVSHIESPVHNSHPSLTSITYSYEFDINNLPNFSGGIDFVNEYCWGGHGDKDLGDMTLKYILDTST